MDSTRLIPACLRRRALALFLPVALFSSAAATEPGPGCVARPYRADGSVSRAHRTVRPDRFGAPARHPVAARGNVHLLVLLAEFSDLPHRIAPSRFGELLFGANGSMRDYYDEVSGGRLDLTGDLHGWVPLPRSQWSYSQGSGGTGAYPNNGQGLAEDAVEAAISAGLDLAEYDADGDGIVDALLVIHSGQGFEWAGEDDPRFAVSSDPDPDAINSHKWVLPDGNFGPGLPEVDDYFTCPELQLVRPGQFPSWSDSIATVGVFCHEFGHMLGLPDIYDTESFDSRVGFWEVMDFGSWASMPGDPPGTGPVHFSAWPKLFLDWSAPDALVPIVGEILEGEVALVSATLGGAPLQLLDNPGGVDWTADEAGQGEYFLAEVRTREGWDAGLPGEGLLIYHVDESSESNRAADHPDGGGILVLLPQDGSLLLGQSGNDPWPGFQTVFGPASHPSSDLHDGTSTGVVLSGIGPVEAGEVRLSIYVPGLRTDIPLPFALPNPFRPASDGEVTLLFSLDTTPPSGVGATIHDVQGRLVRRLDMSTWGGAGGRSVRWDGRRQDGRPALPGVYFFRVDGPGFRGSGRVVVLR